MRTGIEPLHPDLIEPRSMLGPEVKDDAVAEVAQKLLARGHRFEDVALAFDPEVAVKADGLGDQAHERFRTMGVEVIHHQMPRGFGRARGKQRREIGPANIGAFGRKHAIARRVDPAAGAVGLEVHLAQENARPNRTDALNDALFADRRG
jgi:hypothetical protein